MTQVIKTVKTIYDITPQFANQENIQGILVDMDNTLLPWHENRIGAQAKSWIEDMVENGIKVCVITNSGFKRTKGVLGGTGIDFIHRAWKPFPFSFIKGKKKLGVKKQNICVIGDQMITDALGSKIFGIRCIIVDPISPKEQKGTYINRFLERLIFGRDVRNTYDDK